MTAETPARLDRPTDGLPNLLIAGVGKAGTTSLHWYLSQHPDVCASKVKEIGYFAPLVEGAGQLPPLEGYRAHFRACSTERYRLEASPQYFHGGARITRAIRDVLEAPKVIVMLRDPVERLWSQYRFMRSRLSDLPDDLSFEGYVERCLEVRRSHDRLGPESRRYWAVQGGFYVEHLDPWVETFGDDLRLVFSERLAAAPARVFSELCVWLSIDANIRISFTVENRTVPVRSRTLQRIALAANSERLLRGRRWIKAPLRKLYYAMNRPPATGGMSQETERMLRAEFAPGNRDLAERVSALGYRDLPDWLAATATDASGEGAS